MSITIIEHHPIKTRVAVLIVLATAAFAWLSPSAYAQDGASKYTFSTRGIRMPGTQLQYDAEFELMDFNGDGKLDLFMPNTAMMMYVVHLNEGTATQPCFGQAVSYPLNITETVPQTTEHNQAQTNCDLNDDGLWDMIFFDGQLRYAANTGTAHGPFHWRLWVEAPAKPQFFPGTPAMIAENARFATGPETMYWNRGIFGRQVLTLTAADWDGDGLQDLIISRFKGEAPGVKSTGTRSQWTAWGRRVESVKAPLPSADEPQFWGPLKEAPPRGLYFYKNVGSKGKPWFDKGVEITTPDGQSIAAPNPVVRDIDGDGVLDIISSETQYSCNAFRVDWPTAPAIQFFHRASGTDVSHLQPPTPLLDSTGKAIPAGTKARLGDMNGDGTADLVVLDKAGSIRVYPNSAKAGKAVFGAPQVLSGTSFLRFDFIPGCQVVNWFGPNSRDLIVFGTVDQHCKFAYRRIALYKNIATKPGEVQYDFVGWFNYKGDEAMVPVKLERSIYDSYGSSVAVSPYECGPKQIIASVGGRLYRFSGLGKDGLAFSTMTPIDLKAEQNLNTGQQEIPATYAEPVKYIRLTNDRNGQGNFRDSMLHIVNFEALSGDKNVAAIDNVESFHVKNESPILWSKPRRPEKMFTPGNTEVDGQMNFTTFGYAHGPATITLKEPAKLDKIRILFSQYEESMFRSFVPFYWQGQLYHQNMEKGQPWYQYVVEVSTDGKKWELVANRMRNEMNRSHPVLTDWDKDGKMDLLLGVQISSGTYPVLKQYRLYRNTGTNEAPVFDKYELLSTEKGAYQPKANWTLSYTEQCGISVYDMNGDGKPDVFVEGDGAGPIQLLRNISDQPGGVKFTVEKPFREDATAFYSGDRHYFDVADVDGDGLPDMLQSSWGSFFFYKGFAAAAPPRVSGIRVVKTAGTTATLSWKKPAGATSYEIRWNRGSLEETAWPSAALQKGVYGNGETETAVLNGLPAGEEVLAAIKSFNGKGEASAISQAVTVATAPLTETIVRNGPADGVYPAYNGAMAAVVNAAAPAAVQKTEQLGAYASGFSKPGHRMILLRFKDLPKVANLQHADLELTMPSPLPQVLAISCNSIRADWDPATVTWNNRQAGQPWDAGELMGGGTFLSCMQTNFNMDPGRRARWDITPAIREAQANGCNTINLLVRFDYTGKYIDGSAYIFEGMDNPNIEVRPRLRLVGRS